MSLRRFLLATLLGALGGTAHAVEFGGPIDYLVEGEVMLQSQRNPFRFSDALADQRQSSMAIRKGINGSIVVPLLSNRTRFEWSGKAADVSYNRYPELDHRPMRSDMALPWQAGDLFMGNVGYTYDSRLYRYLNRSFPNRDMVEMNRPFGEIGLRVTESLTLPVLTVTDTRLRYDFADDATLFDRDERRMQLALRYQGWDRSFVSAGVWQADGSYPHRTDAQATLIGRHYDDREAFVSGQWAYSAKTILGGKIGMRQRRYDELPQRNSNIPSVLLRAGWDYSAKTRFDVNLWREAYPNDEDPAVLYTTLTGARLSARWQATEKTMVSFNVVYEKLRDTMALGTPEVRRAALRFGPRVEWAVDRNITVVLDGWHDATRSASPFGSFRDNIVRLGIVFSHNNSDAPRPRQMRWHAECDPPKYVESSLCN